jgi:hypothetical protein
MTAQAVRHILAETPAADGLTDVELELNCGCVVRAHVDENRLLTAEDGVRLAIGKYPCPKGHAPMR